MSLKCIGCNTPIPAGATNCPMCGAPVRIAAPAGIVKEVPPSRNTVPPPIVQHVTEVHHHHSTQHEKPVLIEATSKKWKKLYLFAWLFVFLGMSSCAAATDGSTGAGVMTGIFFLAAFVTYMRARVGAWWNHG